MEEEEQEGGEREKEKSCVVKKAKSARQVAMTQQRFLMRRQIDTKLTSL